MSLLPRRCLPFLLWAGLLIGCKSSVGLDASKATSLNRVGGDAQAGTVAEQLDQPLVVRAVSTTGVGVPGVQVTWAVASGGGQVTPANSVTDAQGNAQASWVLGTRTGEQTVRAGASGGISTTFTAEADPGALETLTIAPATVSFDALGDTLRLRAVGADQYENEIGGLPVSWSVADEQVATIDAEGLLTVHGNGSTRVRAAGAVHTDSITIDVEQKPASIQITAPEDTLYSLGATVQLQATALDRLGNPIHGASPSWISADPNVLTVDGGGRVVSVSGGSTLILASYAGAIGALRVTVWLSTMSGNPAASLRVTPGYTSIPLGGTVRLLSNYLDAGGQPTSGPPLTWTTSAPGIATVDGSGNIVGVATGTATIEAKGGGFSAAVTIAVVSGASGLKGVIVGGNNQSGPAGTELSQPLVLRIEDANGNPVAGQIINWTVVSGGGTMFSGVTVSGAVGTTLDYWTLGPSGVQRLEARAVDSTTGAAITFAVFEATLN
jgi:Bacterial Ig-like domain (group 2)